MANDQPVKKDMSQCSFNRGVNVRVSKNNTEWSKRGR